MLWIALLLLLTLVGPLSLLSFLECEKFEAHLFLPGIPARPDPPVVDSVAGGSVVVRLSTLHSGVRDSSTDQFQFILLVSFPFPFLSLFPVYSCSLFPPLPPLSPLSPSLTSISVSLRTHANVAAEVSIHSLYSQNQKP